jgi:hypothetical protein
MGFREEKIIKIFRIALSFISLLSVSLFSPYLTEFFSSDGFINSAQMMSIQSTSGGGNSFSLFFFNDTKVFVCLCYFSMIVALFLLLLGIKPTINSFISWILYLSFYNRFPAIGYGGSEILIMTLFLCFLIYLFPFNWTVLLVKINFAIIYLFAGITKLTHSTWMNGTELAATINSNYGVFDYSWVGEFPNSISILVYSSIITELCYAFIIWFERTRLFVLLMTLGLNLGIILTLQVTFFPQSMLVGSILFLKEKDFEQIKNFSLYLYKFIYQIIMDMNKKIFFPLFSISIIFILSYLFADSLWYPYFNKGCKFGYVRVSANTQRGISKDFCVMKYEAKKDPVIDSSNALAISTPYYSPWTLISYEKAKQACKRSNANLITNDQWMTIAERIAKLPINDISPEAGIQLASGNSNGLGRTLGARKIDDPYIWRCNLNLPLYSYENRYRGNLCELRGESANLFTNKGYFGTDKGFEIFSGNYNAGSLDRGLLRTHVIEEQSLIWDFAGNAWEWVDSKNFYEPTTGTFTGVGNDTEGFSGDMPRLNSKFTTTNFHEYSEISDWNGNEQFKPLDGMNSNNGIGMIYLNPGRSWGPEDEVNKDVKAIVRGGAWGNPKEAGIFALNISHSPNNMAPYIGFRCTYELE